MKQCTILPDSLGPERLKESVTKHNNEACVLAVEEGPLQKKMKERRKSATDKAGMIQVTRDNLSVFHPHRSKIICATRAGC